MIPQEVPPAFLADVAATFRGKLLIAETRPEFVTEETFAPFIETLDDGSWKTPLYCAIGLETSNDANPGKVYQQGIYVCRILQRAAQRAHKQPGQVSKHTSCSNRSS